ncbi:MAG: GAF domain-containing protein [Bacteroidota bacterium]
MNEEITSDQDSNNASVKDKKFRLTIANRMGIAFGGVLLLILILGFIILYQFRKVDKSTDLLTERNFPFQLYALDLATTMDEQKASLIRYLVDGDQTQKEEYQAAEKREKIILNKLSKLSDTPYESEIIRTISDEMDSLNKQGAYVIQLDSEVDRNYYAISEAIDGIDDLLDKEIGPYVDILTGEKRGKMEEVAGELETGIQESLLALAEYILLKGNLESKEEYKEAERNLQIWQETFIRIAETADEVGWSKSLNENMDEIIEKADLLIINFDKRNAEYQKYSKLESMTDEHIETELLTHAASMVNDNTSMINRISSDANIFISISLLVVALLAVTAGILITRSITRPVKGLKHSVQTLSLGKIPEFNFRRSDDEIGDMVDVLIHFSDDQASKAQFAEQIGQGNYNSDYSVHSKEDLLGNGLLKMRDNLKLSYEKDIKRNWANEGYAKFVSLLRSDQENLTALTDQIVFSLVEYLDANQASLFLKEHSTDDEAPTMKLMSCYAWNRKKHLKDTIEMGEGLIGQSWREEKSIFLTDVPNDFIKITSGLGDANPRCIFIVPLINNESIEGILEIASFSILEDYKKEFIERVAESMAGAFASIGINIKTKKLLQQSQIQGEELRAQEEEMRQGQEELKAIQEEMERQKSELEEEVAKLKKELEGANV